MAPTAAGNTTSALPITACAAATSQKFGDEDIATAPIATVTAAMTINARFHRVQSIEAPKGARGRRSRSMRPLLPMVSFQEL
jgi:hypothetical protein